MTTFSMLYDNIQHVIYVISGFLYLFQLFFLYFCGKIKL